MCLQQPSQAEKQSGVEIGHVPSNDFAYIQSNQSAPIMPAQLVSWMRNLQRLQAYKKLCCRYKHRSVYDIAEINKILAEGLTCHVAFVADGLPVCIPTAYAKIGDRLYIHGSIASRMLKTLKVRSQLASAVEAMQDGSGTFRL